jgi:hypothetical protein
MARQTRWSKWMSENIRYALQYDELSPVKYTYSEYFYNTFQNGQGIIDIVGKYHKKDKLSDSIVVEIKSSLPDLNSGMGQNFIGKYNFYATDSGFIDKLVGLRKDFCMKNGVGILLVNDDGTLKTLIPAKNGKYTKAFSSNFDKFSTDDDVESFFATTVIPQQMRCDADKPLQDRI